MKNGLSKVIENNIEKYRQSTARISVVDKDGNPVSNSEVKVRQKNSAFRFGCNAFMLNQFETEEENKAYEKLFCKVLSLVIILPNNILPPRYFYKYFAFHSSAFLAGV